MKRKIFNMITIIICVFVLIELLIKKEIIYDSVIYALNMWVNNLIPALFPFFIISDILINYNITLYIPKIIKDFCKAIFNITDNMLSILFLSMISGFPSNARNTRIMYDNNLISLEEANHILIFSHFSNPIFVLTTVGVFFFNYESVGSTIQGVLTVNHKRIHSDFFSFNHNSHFTPFFSVPDQEKEKKGDGKEERHDQCIGNSSFIHHAKA